MSFPKGINSSTNRLAKGENYEFRRFNTWPN